MECSGLSFSLKFQLSICIHDPSLCRSALHRLALDKKFAKTGAITPVEALQMGG